MIRNTLVAVFGFEVASTNHLKPQSSDLKGLRLQHCNNIQRIAIIKAFIAVRLLQLQNMAQDSQLAKDISCHCYVNDMTWKLLWLKVEKRRLPEQAPSLHWLYYGIAKLVGWYDSKARCWRRS